MNIFIIDVTIIGHSGQKKAFVIVGPGLVVQEAPGGNFGERSIIHTGGATLQVMESPAMLREAIGQACLRRS